jgi:hypothetical protein
MPSQRAVLWLSLSFLILQPISAYAIDESAADLVARGRLHLSDITDGINRKYKGEREKFWDISSIAYHDFTGVPGVDVVVGLEGYQDKGAKYNDGKQVVEDAGAAFAYFHREKDEWKLKQVELLKGLKYDGFEGADLMGLGKDQLVVYSSSGNDKIATVFMVPMDHVLKQVALVDGKDFGPRVTQLDKQVVLVDFRRALVKDCDNCQIFYGAPFIWKDHHFEVQSNDFIDAAAKYSQPDLSAEEKQEGLAWFENFLSAHPKDFCALANCYDLSQALGLTDKIESYKKQLIHLGMDAELNLQYCDPWLADKNRTFQEQYLEELQGKATAHEHGKNEL